MAQSQKRHPKGRLGPCLPHQHHAGCDVNQYVHAVIPLVRRIFENITGRILVDNQSIHHEKYYLHSQNISHTTYDILFVSTSQPAT